MYDSPVIPKPLPIHDEHNHQNRYMSPPTANSIVFNSPYKMLYGTPPDANQQNKLQFSFNLNTPQSTTQQQTTSQQKSPPTFAHNPHVLQFKALPINEQLNSSQIEKYYNQVLDYYKMLESELSNQKYQNDSKFTQIIHKIQEIDDQLQNSVRLLNQQQQEDYHQILNEIKSFKQYLDQKDQKDQQIQQQRMSQPISLKYDNVLSRIDSEEQQIMNEIQYLNRHPSTQKIRNNYSSPNYDEQRKNYGIVEQVNYYSNNIKIDSPIHSQNQNYYSNNIDNNQFDNYYQENQQQNGHYKKSIFESLSQNQQYIEKPRLLSDRQSKQQTVSIQPISQSNYIQNDEQQQFQFSKQPSQSSLQNMQQLQVNPQIQKQTNSQIQHQKPQIFQQSKLQSQQQSFQQPQQRERIVTIESFPIKQQYNSQVTPIFDTIKGNQRVNEEESFRQQMIEYNQSQVKQQAPNQNNNIKLTDEKLNKSNIIYEQGPFLEQSVQQNMKVESYQPSMQYISEELQQQPQLQQSYVLQSKSDDMLHYLRNKYKIQFEQYQRPNHGDQRIIQDREAQELTNYIYCNVCDQFILQKHANNHSQFCQQQPNQRQSDRFLDLFICCREAQPIESREQRRNKINIELSKIQYLIKLALKQKDYTQDQIKLKELCQYSVEILNQIIQQLNIIVIKDYQKDFEAIYEILDQQTTPFYKQIVFLMQKAIIRLNQY
ncbi:hypothetical protein pb186bvf_020419 [Paramecium bursaria]